jgi:hypothetical protein
MARSVVLAVGGAALWLSGCSCTWNGVVKSTAMKGATAAHVAGSALLVETRNGGVTVEADPASDAVRIEARITCGGATQAEADERLAGATLEVRRETDQRLVVRPVFPGGARSGDGAGITVRTPGADGVDLYTSNGPIRARGLSGRLLVDTSNGPIEVEDHTGSVRLDTSNGGIVARNVAGALEADTSNGPVRIEDCGGPITADTSNGSITVSLRPDQPGPVHLDTSNGSITLRVGPAFVGSMRLSTSNASVSLRDDLGRVKQQSISRNGGMVEIGEGGDSSILDTSNGRIEVIIGG